jgi:ABC-type dipeptide/oligopeptide/nickel transport system permease subunit
MAIGAGLGAPFGLLGGFAGGIVDRLFMRIVDLLLAFPTLLLALIVVAVLGPGGIQTVLAIGVALIAPIARLTRGEALKVRKWEFVDAARALGARNTRLMRRHVLPNILAPILVYITLRLGTVILTEASLSFLGLGPVPPTPAWGLMVSEGLRYTLVYWWMPILPGVAVFAAVLGANLLGDACRDVLDPRATRRA